VLAALSGDVQIIRNTENLGFARACNQGAKAAKGRYLVFLNNDTIPRHGWLRALVQEVESHPEVAVVGSKLLYPDGTVQHAGVGFSRICFTPYHVYGGFPGDAEAVSRRREFQAVTAACMLVRRHAFEALGGFDEGFVNGFEDVDFCLRVREAGGRIIYQPQSVLIHLESQTPGRKQHEKDNGKRFLERWAEHWWLPDEDAIYVPDGYAVQTQAANGAQKYQLVRLRTEAERACWHVVVDVQRAAQARDQAAVLSCLTADRSWPDDATVLRWAARLCERVGCPERAEWFWHEALKVGEGTDARLALARTALTRGELEQAGEHLSRLHASLPEQAEGWLLQGILAMQQRRFAQADDAFSKAERYGADSRKARLGVIMAALGREEPQRAWEAAVKAAADFPDDPEVLHWLVRAGTAAERWHELADGLSVYMARNPADTAARFTYAGVLLRLDERDLAGREYRRLQLLDPHHEGLEELAKAIEAANAEEPLSVTSEG
jgi:Flp pilus assembly protein TadD